MLTTTRLHTEGNLLAAIAKVNREVTALLDGLASNGVLTNGFKQRCLRAMDSPRTTARPIPSNAALSLIGKNGAPITAQQEREFVETLTTCGIILRQVSSYSDNSKLYASIAMRRIKAQLR